MHNMLLQYIFALNKSIMTDQGSLILANKRGKGRPATKPHRVNRCYHINIDLIARLEYLAEKRSCSISDVINEAGHSLCDVEDVPMIQISQERNGVDL